MIIPFNDKFRINSDRHAWFIQEYVGDYPERKGGTPVPNWKSIKWYSTFEKCLLQAAEMTLQTSSADTPMDALAEIKTAHSAFDTAMREYKELLKLELKGEGV